MPAKTGGRVNLYDSLLRVHTDSITLRFQKEANQEKMKSKSMNLIRRVSIGNGVEGE